MFSLFQEEWQIIWQINMLLSITPAKPPKTVHIHLYYSLSCITFYKELLCFFRRKQTREPAIYAGLQKIIQKIMLQLAVAFADLASFYQTVYLVENLLNFVKNSQKYSLKPKK